MVFPLIQPFVWEAQSMSSLHRLFRGALSYRLYNHILSSAETLKIFGQSLT